MTRPTASRASGSTAVPLVETRRDQILEAAVALFAAHGYVDTKIEDISNAIGVGKGLIYRYFDDKLDLLFHSLCAVIDKQRAEIGRLMEVLGPVGALRQTLRQQCTMSDARPLEVLLAYRATRDLRPAQRQQIKAAESSLVDELRRCIDACVAGGLMQPFNSRNLAYQMLMYSHTWALKRWTLGRDFDIGRYIADGEQLLIAPFLTEAGRSRFANAGGLSGA